MKKNNNKIREIYDRDESSETCNKQMYIAFD